MCRFIVYVGKELVLSDLVVHPKHSLINQSYQSRERCEPLNGDGFGVGWYAPGISSEPGIFVATSPAWSNRNLRRLADKVTSPLIFAHVRAASKGLTVSEYNCHPFQHKNMMWMHNGRIFNFAKIKRKLINTLREDLYAGIEGSTDTEHAFAVFLNFLPKDLSQCTPAMMKRAVIDTIAQLNTWTKEAGAEEASAYNFAVTDGSTVIVTRYCDEPDVLAETLYFSRGARYECIGDVCKVFPVQERPEAILIASEPLTDNAHWEPVPINHILMVDKDLKVQLEPISV